MSLNPAFRFPLTTQRGGRVSITRKYTGAVGHEGIGYQVAQSAFFPATIVVIIPTPPRVYPLTTSISNPTTSLTASIPTSIVTVQNPAGLTLMLASSPDLSATISTPTTTVTVTED